MPLNGTRREATADPLHALAPLTGFNLVIVDERTPKSILKDLYDRQVTIKVAKAGWTARSFPDTHLCAAECPTRGPSRRATAITRMCAPPDPVLLAGPVVLLHHVSDSSPG
ncbi:hypothetical protein HEP87_53870 [Streptomyces sp. S1D4-11]|nr:hypothetical protein [Streptomyces sp. S1D4-11]QIZ00951.1 hypothetical protein HEP87_53870 [Streptomyces sp. S1D4-11]